jgi:hypothetical protein
METVKSCFDHGWYQFPESSTAMQHNLQTVLVAKIGEAFQMRKDEAVK